MPYQHHPEVVYDYVEPLDPNLMCAICQSALIDPVTTTSCKHTFCRDCISRALVEKPQCPIDRSALGVVNLRDTEMLVKLMLDELKVRCAAPDCGKIMQRGLLLAHVKSCQKTLVTCHSDECGLSMARHRLAHHRAYDCFQRQMGCDKCGVLLTFKNQTDHAASHSDGETDSMSSTCDACGETCTNLHLHTWACPQAPVVCPHLARGCGDVVPRSELEVHLAQCPFEKLAGFFAENDARFTAAERKMKALDEELAFVRREMAEMRERDARRQLNVTTPQTNRGGMYTPRDWVERRSALEQLVRTDRLVDPAPSSSQSEESVSAATQGDVDAPGQSDRAMTDDRLDRALASLDLNRPLPSGQDASGASASDSRNSRLGRRMFTPSFGSHQTFADYAFARLSETPRTVGESLDALTRVVGHLAAGMDTMERRNEVRTMTETLRVLEEVGRLQAIVNTIRMQVMMDRPAPSPLRNSFTFSAPADTGAGTAITTTTTTTTTETRQGPIIPGPNTVLRPLRDLGIAPDEDTASITESVVFSPVPRNAGESTSSLVSAGGGYPRGLPMGLPAEEQVDGVGRRGSVRGLRGRRISLPVPVAFRRQRRDRGSVSGGAGPLSPVSSPSPSSH